MSEELYKGKPVQVLDGKRVIEVEATIIYESICKSCPLFTCSMEVFRECCTTNKTYELVPFEEGEGEGEPDEL